MPATSLSERNFERLTRELSDILTEANKASIGEKVHGYWSLGQRIIDERLSEEAGYHNAILRELTPHLGVSARLLQQTVLFASVYPDPPPGPLSWAHYRLLAALDSKKERSFYTKGALADSWSVRDLKAAIAADLFSGGEPEAPVLSRPTSSGFIYKAEAPRIVDGDTIDVDVDLGFQTWTKRRLRLAHIDCPESGSPEGRAAKNYLRAQLARARTIVLKSHKVDLHGRYVADLFLSPTLLDIDECYRSGKYLNALLVQSGHATIVG